MHCLLEHQVALKRTRSCPFKLKTVIAVGTILMCDGVLEKDKRHGLYDVT